MHGDRYRDPVLYLQVGNTGVYWPSYRDIMRERLDRHMDEHGCGVSGFPLFKCPIGKHLFEEAQEVAVG